MENLTKTAKATPKSGALAVGVSFHLGGIVQAGDLLLVTGQGKLSASLVAAQKIVYQQAVSSHVEFSLGDGTFVHATGDGGVHLTFVMDELKSCEPNWRAIRLKGITEAQQECLTNEGMYYLRQDYNKIFMGSGNDHSSFCSELIAKIYQKAGIEILSKKQPSKVAPAHFDREADIQMEWEDVTEEYKSTIEEISKDPFPYQLAFSTIKQVMARRHIHSKLRKMIFEYMQSDALASGNGEKFETIEGLKKFLKENRQLHFWDEHDEN